MKPINPIRFGTATYVQNVNLRAGNGDTDPTDRAANALVDYLQTERGLRSERMEWGRGQQFVLNGKDLVTINKVRQDFEQSFDALRQHVFKGADRSLDGRNAMLMADYLKKIQTDAENARSTTIKILKNARVWRTLDWGWRIDHPEVPRFRKNLLSRVEGQKVLAGVFNSPKY
jgi:hypothetical protein